MPKRRPPVTFPYCQAPAKLLTSSASLYPSGKDYGPAWACLPCHAWVGCHPGTTAPLGRLADGKLRRLKIKAHAEFDPLWRAKIRRDGCGKSEARRAAYMWPARELGISEPECHIGLFDEAMCQRAIEVCEAVRVKMQGRAA